MYMEWPMFGQNRQCDCHVTLHSRLFEIPQSDAEAWCLMENCNAMDACMGASDSPSGNDRSHNTSNAHGTYVTNVTKLQSCGPQDMITVKSLSMMVSFY